MNTYTADTFQKFSKRSKHTSSEHEQDNKRGCSKQSYKHQRQVKRGWEGE